MMRLPRFKYHSPKTLSDACKMLVDFGPETTVVAGGTDLYPKMKRRQMNYKHVIGLRLIKSLKEISKDSTRIGSLVTLTELQEKLLHSYSVICEAASLISTPILQNMGTVGGNLCLDTRCNYYDQNYYWRKSIDFCMKKDGKICWVAPSSPRCWAVTSCDLAPVMIALNAKLVIKSNACERIIDAEHLYNNDGIDFLTKKQDEILTSVELPPPNGWKAVYLKLRRRGAFDFPVLSVAACMWFEKDVVKDCRIVLGAVTSAPIRVREAEQSLIGKPLSKNSIHEASEKAYVKGKPLDNTDFNMNWRKEMIKVYTRRSLEKLMHESV